MPLQRYQKRAVLMAAMKGPQPVPTAMLSRDLSCAISLAVHQPPTRTLGTALQNTRIARG